MSDIPRYRPVSNDRYGITDDADGKLCEYRDYARLKAENERLTAIFVTENLILRAQVERLTKAGDMTAGRLERFCKDWGFSDEETKDQTEEWRAVKEGKDQP